MANYYKNFTSNPFRMSSTIKSAIDPTRSISGGLFSPTTIQEIILQNSPTTKQNSVVDPTSKMVSSLSNMFGIDSTGALTKYSTGDDNKADNNDDNGDNGDGDDVVITPKTTFEIKGDAQSTISDARTKFRATNRLRRNDPEGAHHTPTTRKQAKANKKDTIKKAKIARDKALIDNIDKKKIDKKK
tara:strand:+ start:5815 stop:6372 length:558 start_codon:yes stop_codon:yes gene_type:complete